MVRQCTMYVFVNFCPDRKKFTRFFLSETNCQSHKMKAWLFQVLSFLPWVTNNCGQILKKFGQKINKVLIVHWFAQQVVSYALKSIYLIIIFYQFYLGQNLLCKIINETNSYCRRNEQKQSQTWKTKLLTWRTDSCNLMTKNLHKALLSIFYRCLLSQWLEYGPKKRPPYCLKTFHVDFNALFSCFYRSKIVLDRSKL